MSASRENRLGTCQMTAIPMCPVPALGMSLTAGAACKLSTTGFSRAAGSASLMTSGGSATATGAATARFVAGGGKTGTGVVLGVCSGTSTTGLAGAVTFGSGAPATASRRNRGGQDGRTRGGGASQTSARQENRLPIIFRTRSRDERAKPPDHSRNLTQRSALRHQGQNSESRQLQMLRNGHPSPVPERIEPLERT